jgi:diacylglycerol kinase family enzyme
MSAPSVTVILNEAAGAGAKKDKTLRDLIIRILGQHGMQTNVRVVTHGDTITAMAEAAVRDGATVVVAGGGDGTVSSVASVLVDSEVALGILPLGTLNHFAKDLGLPLEIEKALEVIGAGTVRKVDAGDVNGRVFVNNSSLGLYPTIVRGRKQEQRLGRGKWAALLWATLAALRRYPILSVALVSPNKGKFARRTPVVFIGNNQYETMGFRIGSRSKLDSGMLAVYIARKDGAAALLKMGIAALFGTVRRRIDFDYLAVEKLRIDVRGKTIQVANDGEVSSFVPPLLYRMHHLGLKVIVPLDK